MGSYTFERATPGAIVGRVVGDGGNHIAVAVRGEHVLAVRRDGLEYVTWTFGYRGDNVVCFWGHYFLAAQDTPAAVLAAYEEAMADLQRNPAGTLVTVSQPAAAQRRPVGRTYRAPLLSARPARPF
jgi:hypothetical protein